MLTNEQTTTIIIVTMLCAIMVLIAVIFIMALVFFKNKTHENAESDKKFKIKNNDDLPKEGTCFVHPLENAKTICAICSNLLCQNCNRDYDHLHFCPTHFETFIAYNWKPVTTVIAHPNRPLDGLALHHFKDNLWQSHKTPSYIVTHYKIDVESDQIESYIQLYVREEEYEMINSKLIQHELKKSTISQ